MLTNECSLLGEFCRKLNHKPAVIVGKHIYIYLSDAFDVILSGGHS